MCGIAGLIDHRANSPEETLASMLSWLQSRGPDGEGTYVDGALAIGMRRLSIIDLEHGWQPLRSLDGAIVAFQNGEIYNYRELRRELEGRGFSFTTQSDTEVLAHGYAAWGIEGLLDRLDGMYALAILDRRSGELHLARDPFGEKPFFYAASPGRFAYASQLLAVAALEWVDKSVDDEALNDYLALHYVAGEHTIFRGVKRLLPGCRMTLRVADPKPSIERYYRLRLDSRRKVTDDELARVVEQAVTSRLVADVPVGIFLSGGLDSSVVAALAAKAQPRVMTFSMGFDSPEHDESRHAEALARNCGTDHHTFRFDMDSFETLLPQVAASLDEPLGDQAALPLLWLCREARKYVKVVLSGEGADEIFAGYGYYRKMLPPATRGLLSRWRKPPAQGAALERLIHNPVPDSPSGFPLLTDVAGRERLLRHDVSEPDAYERDLMRWLDSSRDPLQRAMGCDLGSWLPDDLLVKFDRMTMAQSIEGRAPFLSRKLVELAMSGYDPHQRMTRTDSKLPLRRVARRWVPAEILDRPKQGFVLPMKRWLSTWMERRGGAAAYFSHRPLPGMDVQEAARLVEEDLAQGVHRERLIFALVMLAEWWHEAQARLQAVANR
jgi:asparagine synthase (glutamine-hydrolysing)